MAKQESEVYHPCAFCDRDTWHSVICSHRESAYEYREDFIYSIVQCCGCKSVSFRKVVLDIESAYPTDEDEWEVPETVSCFPRVLKGHKELEDIWELPDIVRQIYSQSVQAIKDDSNILAGIGLRATIEAICNDRGIAGKTLEKRIDGLAKNGLISQKDAERLHAIRFLGNDSAHEIKSSAYKNLLIALRIIEHLLVNIYVLDGVADGSLETIIKTPDQFMKLLAKKVGDLAKSDEIPLAKIFGKDMRRFHGYLSTHEQYLVAQINAGTYTNLLVGKFDKYGNSSEKLQHFIVN